MPSAVERKWHVRDSEGQITAVPFRPRSLKHLNPLFTPKRTRAYTPPLENDRASCLKGFAQGLRTPPHKLCSDVTQTHKFHYTYVQGGFKLMVTAFSSGYTSPGPKPESFAVMLCEQFTVLSWTQCERTTGALCSDTRQCVNVTSHLHLVHPVCHLWLLSLPHSVYLRQRIDELLLGTEINYTMLF